MPRSPASVTDATGPLPGSEDGLRVRVLGLFEVEAVPAAQLGSRKTRQFLKLLALRAGEPVSVDRAVEALWGDRVPAKPNDQLSVLASRLRAALGTDRIRRSDGGYTLLVDWVDRDELEALAADAARRLAAGQVAAAGAAARAALHLARGPLLADEPDAPWAEADRRVVDRLVNDVVAIAAEAELAVGNATEAAALATRGLDADPYDERALRLLMAARWQAGRPASALGAYAEVRARLRDDLGVHPAPETEALHEQILLAGDAPDAAHQHGPRPDRATSAGAGTPTTEAPSAGAPRPRHVAVPSVLVGRDAELDRLDDVAREGAAHTRVVVVEGEAGIGKSALLAHWVASRAAGRLVLWGRCEELGRDLPLQAVADALAAHLGSLDPSDAAAILGADERVLRPLLGGLGGRAGVGGLGSAGGANDRGEADGVPSTAAGSFEARTGQAALFGAVLDLVARLARHAGAVLVLDDVHLADESTSAWVRFARRRDAVPGLLVVGAAREGTDVWPAADVRLPLDVLTREAVMAFVEADRGPARAPADVDRLLERSGGHPLFLVELAGAPPGALPSSIRAAVAGRRRELGAAGLTVEAAAVLGDEVDLDLLTAVLRRPPLDVLGDLEAAVGARVLDEQGARFVFHHALVREALADAVSGSRRALLHREAARHLAAHRSGHGDPRRIAHHAREGAEPELASHALTDAARDAAARFDYEAAVGLLTDAIGLADHAEARHARGLVWLALDRYDDAAADAAAALRLGGGASALELAGWAAYYQRDFVAARRAGEEGARRADDPIVRGACEALVGRIAHANGELGVADELLTSAVERAGAHVPVGPVWLSWLRVHQSRPEPALELVQPVLLDPRADHPFAEVHARLVAAYALGATGRPADALAAVDEAEAAMVRRGLEARFEGRMQNWRGWLLRYVGAAGEADDWNRAALESAERNDLPEPLAHALLDLADAALHRGDLQEARDRLDAARPLHDHVHAMRWRHALRAQLLEGRLALGAGDTATAREHLAAVRADAKRLGVERYVCLADLASALTSLVAGDTIDVAAVDRTLGRLPAVAGLEAWWWTNELARHAAVDEWRGVADQRGAALVAAAGAHASAATAWVAARRGG